MAKKNQKRDKDTYNRIRRMQREFSKNIKITTFENEENYDQMIIQRGIPFMSLCEHHRIAFLGSVIIGYIPKNRLIGLSKLARVVEMFFNPTIYTIQEKGTQQICNFLWKSLNPLGVMVVVKANHGCISYRGVKKPSETITSAFKGVFKNQTTRSEFINLSR